MNSKLLIRPSVINKTFWNPQRPAEWDEVRKSVLERDNYTCCGCGHHAVKFMNVHHLKESEDNTPNNLVTLCVACHAVLHIGLNLNLKAIEIWQSPLSQVQIIDLTRAGVRKGQSLEAINKTFQLKPGPMPPNSVSYANELLRKMGNAPRGYLDEPLSAVFVKFSRWQLE